MAWLGRRGPDPGPVGPDGRDRPGRFAAQDAIERGVVDALGADYDAELPDPGEGPDWYQPQWRSVLIPVPLRSPRVSVRHNVVYGRASGKDLRLDVFVPETAGRGRPVIVYVHGGGWVLGFRDRQGVPLLSELAERGWIGIRPAYRLSPVATYPDHLIDVKRAIAWVRENAEELGADPDFVVVSGGSAGGHLAALAALTADNPALQPGFEDADTSVAACVPIYGVYDPRNDLGHQTDDFARFFTEVVVKADPDEDPDRWALASAFAQLHPGAPPFLIVHGERDSLTSAQEAGAFASKLEEQTHAEVGLALLPGAQHAFDVFPSIRTAFVVRGVARFLTVLHVRRHARAVMTHDREDDR
jgi:acetyl esterase/lipase